MAKPVTRFDLAPGEFASGRWPAETGCVSSVAELVLSGRLARTRLPRGGSPAPAASA